MLDADNADWPDFFVAKLEAETVAFARIKDHRDYFELASLGVDYYQRHKGIGKAMLFFIRDQAQKLDPGKPIYGVTHRPGFLEKGGFKEAKLAPEALEYKKNNKCLDPAKIQIMRYVEE